MIQVCVECYQKYPLLCTEKTFFALEHIWYNIIENLASYVGLFISVWGELLFETFKYNIIYFCRSKVSLNAIRSTPYCVPKKKLLGDKR